MSQVFADRVVDTTATVGTGPFVLDSPDLTGYRNIADVCADGDTIWYSATHPILNQWEVGKGTYGAGTGILTRTQILASSNGGAAVNFSSGTKDVIASIPAYLASSLYNVIDGTSGYALLGNGLGAPATYQAFTQAGTGAVARTWNAKGVDFVSLADFGTAGDGSTNDSTGILAADALTVAKFIPQGSDVYVGTSVASTDLDGPYWGFGNSQIRDSAGNKRAPWFSAVKAAPASNGSENSIETAFGGDLSKTQIVMEHRITGSATLGQPTSGYSYSQGAYPRYGWLYNSSGYNHSTTTNDGRTAAVFERLHIYQAGNGDAFAYNVSAFVNSTKSGSTVFLANPAVGVINADLTAGIAGAYLNAGEFVLSDGGFDAAGIGWVVNLDRDINTGAKSAWWAGYRVQSIGSVDVDTAFSAIGGFKYGLDLSQSTPSAGAIALKADQKILGNATADSSSLGRYPNAAGDDYFTFSSSLNAWNFVVDNASALQIYTNQASVNGPFFPINSDGGALGSTTKMWSDLFLASGAVINFDNGDVTITHAANALTFAGAPNGYIFDGYCQFTDVVMAAGGHIGAAFGAGNTMILGAWDVDGSAWQNFITFTANNTPTCTMSGVTASATFTPTASDGAALGTGALMWSDLFLASGAVVNFNNGDVTLTHGSHSLTMAGGKHVFAATTTSYAAFNLPTGSAPSSPADGDVWREDNTNTGLKVRINGVTKTVTVA